MFKPSHPQIYTIIKSGSYCIDDLGVLLKNATAGDAENALDAVEFLPRHSATNRAPAGPFTFSDGKNHIWCKFRDGVPDGSKTTRVMVIESDDKALMLRCAALLGARVLNNDDLDDLQRVPERSRLGAVRAMQDSQSRDIYTRSRMRQSGLESAVFHGAVSAIGAQNCIDMLRTQLRMSAIDVPESDLQVKVFSSDAPQSTSLVLSKINKALKNENCDIVLTNKIRITINDNSTQQTVHAFLNSAPANSHALRTIMADEVAGYMARQNMTVLTLEDPDSASAKRALVIRRVNEILERALSLQDLDAAVLPVIAQQVESKGFTEIEHARIALPFHSGSSYGKMSEEPQEYQTLCVPLKSISDMAEHIPGVTNYCGAALSDVLYRSIQNTVAGVVTLERDPNGDVLQDRIKVRPSKAIELDCQADILLDASSVTAEDAGKATKAAVNGYVLVGVREEGHHVKDALKDMLNAVTLNQAIQSIERTHKKEDAEQSRSSHDMGM